MTPARIDIWRDAEWSRDSHSGTGPWTVSRCREDGDEIGCVGSFRGRGVAERVARRAVARALGVGSLRGLAQAPTAAGTRWSYRGRSVEMVWA